MNSVAFLFYFYNNYKIVCIYLTPSPRAGCDTRLIFKRSKAGRNSEFSFSLTGCLFLYRQGGRETGDIYESPKGIRAKWNENR